MTLCVAVFGSSQTELDSREWSDAVTVGATLAANEIEVVTGGYGGTMEAVSLGASKAGGHVVGVIAPSLFPDRTGANAHVSELIEAPTLSARIDLMMSRADATFTLPGSIGTATELLTAWNMNYIARRAGGQSLPSVAIGAQWQNVADALVRLIDAENDGIHWANSVEDGLEWMLAELEVLRSNRAGS